MLFNVTIPDDKNNCVQRIIAYGNPALFGLLNRRVQIYINDTFRCVPHPFDQLFNVMVHDVQIGVYVSIVYILMTTKTFEM